MNRNTNEVVQSGISSDLNIVYDGMNLEDKEQKSKELFVLINIAFMIAYAISQMASGSLYDMVGTRKGFTISVLIWGGTIALTSVVSGIKQLAFFRVLLGLGEAGPWPKTAKSNSGWFPIKERAITEDFFGGASLFRKYYCTKCYFFAFFVLWMAYHICYSRCFMFIIDSTLDYC